MQNRNPQWAKKIKKRDGNVCFRCGIDSDAAKLEAHHIMPVKAFPQSQYTNCDSNGLALCRSCHIEITGKELRANLLEFINEHPYCHNRQSQIGQQLCWLLWSATGNLPIINHPDEEIVKNAVSHSPVASAVDNKQRGKKYLGGSDNDQAIVYCTKSLELDPQDADTYNTRGVAFLEAEDYDRAILDFSRGIEINPHWARLYAHRGDSYWEVDNYEQAIADYYQCLRINQKYVPV